MNCPSSPVVSYSLNIPTTNREGLVRAGQRNSRDYLGKSMALLDDTE